MVTSRVAMKIFECFGKTLFKEFIMGQEPALIIHYITLGLEPVSIVHYTRPGTSIKLPNPN